MVTVVYHTKGAFVRYGDGLRYEGGSILEIPDVDPDTINLLDLKDDLLREGGFEDNFRLFFEVTGSGVDGFKLMTNDNSIRDMLQSYGGRAKYDFYVEHDVPVAEVTPMKIPLIIEDRGAGNSGIETLVADVDGGIDADTGDGINIEENDDDLDDADSSGEEDDTAVDGLKPTEGKRTSKVAVDENLLEGFEWGSDNDDEEVKEVRQKVINLKERLKKGINITYVDSTYYSDDDIGDRSATNEELNSEGFDSDEVGSYIETDLEDEVADHGVRKKSRFTKYQKDTEKPYFELGMVFTNMQEVKIAVNKHSIKECKDIKFKKNEKKRFRVVCKFKGCQWVFYVVYDRSFEHFILKTYKQHTCSQHLRNRRVRANVITETYKRRIRSNPTWKLREIKATIWEDFGTDCHESIISRAKEIALKKTQGCYADEFALLWTYAEEMRKADPGTRVIIKVDRGNPENKPLFQRMYVCFSTLKKGFLEGCQRIVGLDGCFLKGLCRGELLAAIGRDGNNQMYPVAWAIVEVESRDSWSWFLELLIDDLHMENGDGWSISSDQQKRLIPAIATLIPEAEHRLCARHIFCNWKKTHRSPEWQKYFWECAKATTEVKFKQAYQKLEFRNKKAAEDMVRVPKEKWCKAFLSTVVKCDSVDNNMSETFNASIIEPRHKPPYSLLDDIRILTTERIARKLEAAMKWKTPFCPKAMKKLEQNGIYSRLCRMVTCGNQEYEVNQVDGRFKVKLGERSCSCRAWDLSGIPCPHAITCMVYEGKDPSNYLSEWYSVKKYIATYSHTMPAMDGPRQWPLVDLEQIQPPPFRAMPGRPKKKRRKTADEVLQRDPKNQSRLSRNCRIIICSKCKSSGHNSRTCQGKKNAVEGATTDGASATASSSAAKKKPTKVQGGLRSKSNGNKREFTRHGGIEHGKQKQRKHN